MKDVPHIYQFIALLAAIAFFIPLCIVVYKKRMSDRFFLWVPVYWAWGGIVNFIFITNIITNQQILTVVERVYNLADAPLVLFLLYYTLPAYSIKQKLRWVIPIYTAIDLALILITGLNGIAEVILVGSGIVITLICIIVIVSFCLWRSKEFTAGSPRMFVYYALLFEYGVSIITFIFSYILPEKNNIQDSFLVFHVATIITILIAGYGLINHTPEMPARPMRAKKKERGVEIQYL